ncbi:MAG: hypothetical protein ACFE91_11790 [Promethearchaeota archaeon]
MDLHIHSKFSGGASKDIDLINNAFDCGMKEINIVGIGDCLHPLWIRELKNNLIGYSDGLSLTLEAPKVKFILQTEIKAI